MDPHHGFDLFEKGSHVLFHVLFEVPSDVVDLFIIAEDMRVQEGDCSVKLFLEYCFPFLLFLALYEVDNLQGAAVSFTQVLWQRNLFSVYPHTLQPPFPEE